eukprot:CAMPEP_0172746542 /NCGR_PEP_ID=MMETSP1074-20121228/140904_1 /TAXON_ID=2916 /ORGANISM="Ceratium fusus, Strain PA161109" /LENGTH=55 /DNA_ID=CAMNT_0013577929 /DNA_START=489 /DNA_END=656 /DNA_ORIENTATION=-
MGTAFFLGEPLKVFNTPGVLEIPTMLPVWAEDVISIRGLVLGVHRVVHISGSEAW